MNPLTIMVWSTTLLTLFFIATVFWLRAKIEDQRGLNMILKEQLLDTKAERDEWKETCHNGMERDTHRKEVVAVLKRQVTNQAEQIDALLNGDRYCVKGHRFYSGQGITCPSCGAIEVFKLDLKTEIAMGRAFVRIMNIGPDEFPVARDHER